MAWEVSNWKLKAEKDFNIDRFVNAGLVLAVLRRGVVIGTFHTLELWNFELTGCIRQWSLGVKSIIGISDDQVLCEIFSSAEDVIVDTVTGDVVSKSTFPDAEEVIVDTITGNIVSTCAGSSDMLIA